MSDQPLNASPCQCDPPTPKGDGECTCGRKIRKPVTGETLVRLILRLSSQLTDEESKRSEIVAEIVGGVRAAVGDELQETVANLAPPPLQYPTAFDVAYRYQLTPDTVRDHAEEIGGWKVRGEYRFEWPKVEAAWGPPSETETEATPPVLRPRPRRKHGPTDLLPIRDEAA